MKRLLLATTLLCPCGAWAQGVPVVGPGGSIIVTGGTASQTFANALSCTAKCLDSQSQNLLGNYSDETSALGTLFANGAGGTIRLHTGSIGGTYGVSSGLTLSSGTTLVCDAGVALKALPSASLGNGFITNPNFNASSITDHDIQVSGCGVDASALQSATVTISAASRATDSTLTLTVSAIPSGMAANVIGNVSGITGDTSMDGPSRVISASGTTVVLASAGPYPSTGTVTGATLTTDLTGGIHGFAFREVQNVQIIRPYCNDIGDCTSILASNNSIVEDGNAANITNACWDHWDGTTDLHVRGGKCSTLKYGALITGTNTGATAAEYSANGDIIGGEYYLSGQLGVGVWINGLGPASANVAASSMNGTLDVTSITAGTVTVGMCLPPNYGYIPGTCIVPGGSGTGGTGFYNLNKSQTVKAQSMALGGSGANNITVKGIKVIYSTHLSTQYCWHITGFSSFNHISNNTCDGGGMSMAGDSPTDDGFPAFNFDSNNNYTNPYTSGTGVVSFSANTASNIVEGDITNLGNGSAAESFLSAGNQNAFIGNFPTGGTAAYSMTSGANFVSFPQITGTSKATATGCSNSGSTTASATSATVTLGAAGCSLTLTMGAGSFAQNGWTCSAEDLTSPTIFIGQSSSTTTSALISVPVTAGSTDVLSIGCSPL